MTPNNDVSGNEDLMRNTPKPSADRAQGAVIPPPPPADYSDELSNTQIEVLRSYAPQDESKMGPVVHEFRW